MDKETPEVVIPRIRLKEDEYKLILEHRALQEECEDVGIPLENVNHYWYKGKSFSLHVKKDTISYSEVRKELLEELDNYSPTYKNIERKKSLDPHCLVIDPADIHIGKLCTSFESGEDYNTQIAVARVIEGVQGILDKASGFNIDKIVFIGGNDVLHIDTPKRTTTAGTPQDTDGMWYNNFLIAKKAICRSHRALAWRCGRRLCL